MDDLDRVVGDPLFLGATKVPMKLGISFPWAWIVLIGIPAMTMMVTDDFFALFVVGVPLYIIIRIMEAKEPRRFHLLWLWFTGVIGYALRFPQAFKYWGSPTWIPARNGLHHTKGELRVSWIPSEGRSGFAQEKRAGS